jgi:hypothetical protein
MTTDTAGDEFLAAAIAKHGDPLSGMVRPKRL